MSARRAWIALVAAAAYAPACFFELAAVEDVDSGLNGGGGGSGGGGAGGSAGDATVDAACAVGEARCAGECVARDDPAFGCGSCEPCTDFPGTVETCDGTLCAIASCDDGFGDCNGLANDGCETEFAVDWPTPVEPPTSFPLVIHRLPMSVNVNGAGDEWASEQRQPVIAVCDDCTPLLDVIPQVSDLQPRPEDLTAWFRLAWDNFYLYVFAEVRDDDTVNTSAGGMYPEAMQDGIELLIGMDSISTSYGDKNHQLFFALDGGIAKPNAARPEALLAIQQGLECYSAELRVPWRFLTGDTMSQALAGLEIRFDLAINDWDTVPQDGSAVSERQSQLFWTDPGNGYWNNTLGLGSIRLQ